MLLRPAIGLVHELLVVGLAAVLRAVAGAPLWGALVGHLPLDPVYTLAMIRFAGQIEARGVAVAGPPGAALNALLPSLFSAPELVAGPWASAVLEPGATVVARGLAGFGASVGTLAIGLALFLVGLRGRPWLAVCGALQQTHVVLYQFLDAGLSLRDLEAAGLPFAFSALLSDPNRRAPWFTNELEHLPAPMVSLGAGLLLTLLAYLAAGVAVALSRAAWAAILRLRGSGRHHPVLVRPVRWGPAVALAVGVLGVTVSPLGAFAEAQTHVLESEQDLGVGPVSSAAAAPPFGRRHGPATVDIVGTHYRYTLLVDGTPTIIRGMGYNVQYGGLEPEERARRYDRDFGMMREAGVNVLFGWFPEVFIGDTLDKAHEHGLGVAMPYELNQDLDYDDPVLRARLTSNVLRWVAEYKDHPAVWFWSPGNEVIHRLIFPSWLKRTHDPAREARADSFARFYVELIDQIHELDPRHPIVYRDAEELYLARIRAELQRDGKPRPWFFYGTNVYSGRLDEILANWPKQGLDVPLFVSEFSPGGTGPADRPRGLRDMWSSIRAHPDWVLGGAVYTWTTEGPEELDRVFGLVDGAGRPRDGSLAAIGEAYRSEAAGD